MLKEYVLAVDPHPCSLTVSTPVPILCVVAPGTAAAQEHGGFPAGELGALQPGRPLPPQLLPAGKELSVKQIKVLKEQHSYETRGLLPGTKYIVSLRNVKKEISSSLAASTGHHR